MRRIKRRFLIQVFLLVFLLLAQLWVTAYFEKHLRRAAKDRAMAVADGMINSMNMMMLDSTIGDLEKRKLFLRKMMASGGLSELQIIRGKVVQDQFGAGLPQESTHDEFVRQAMARKQTDFAMLGAKDESPSIRTAVPFIASRNFRGFN